MPRVECDVIECKFNHSGVCDNDYIDLDYTGTCQSYEQKSGLESDLEPTQEGEKLDYFILQENKRLREIIKEQKEKIKRLLKRKKKRR